MEKNEWIIKPQENFSLDFGSLAKYRELIYFFAWRDIKIRYRDTLLGIIWTVAQALFLTLVFSVIVSRGFNLPTRGMPPILFFFSGIIVWNYFSQAVTTSANSILIHAHIIRKIYFPRLVIPLSSIITASFDFFINSIALIVISLILKYNSSVEINILYLIIAIILAWLLTTLVALSAGIFLSALNVKYRDVRNAIPFLVQILFFLTPVMYDFSTSSSGVVSYLLKLNPLVLPIEMIRSNIISPSFEMAGFEPLWIIGIIVSLFIALFTFQKIEHQIADII